MVHDVSWPPPNYRPDVGAGYRVTFADFQRLVGEPEIVELLRSWFGDSPSNLKNLHEQIQADPEKQYWLYQRAMDIWR
jgi:hypothetical protein